LRQFILKHHRPQKNGKPLLAPITCGNWGGTTAEVHEDNIRKFIEQRLPIEYYWIDAGWYGKPEVKEAEDWSINVGRWDVKPSLYPKGFKPLSDLLRSDKRELMVWFEPERVFKGTPWQQKFTGKWLLEDGGDNSLMNLGNPEARKFVTDFIADRIKEFGLGCYRQDYNIDPAPFWQKNDTPDRQGMTEIRYIEGLYAFWDGLLERDPNLIIDNCASGGRRIDLETVGRATPSGAPTARATPSPPSATPTACSPGSPSAPSARTAKATPTSSAAACAVPSASTGTTPATDRPRNCPTISPSTGRARRSTSTSAFAISITAITIP
jgi:alpha-galactosidase